jgi:hypothetical protein
VDVVAERKVPILAGNRTSVVQSIGSNCGTTSGIKSDKSIISVHLTKRVMHFNKCYTFEIIFHLFRNSSVKVRTKEILLRDFDSH